MEHTPRNVVLQLGALITMYISASFLLTLLFGLINLTYPAATDSYWEIESASDSVRLGIAMTIVFFPTFLLLTRRVNVLRRTDSTATHQTITKWLIYLSLLLGGLVLLGTLVSTIYTFLNGDLTTRFILKAASVVGVVGMAVHYFVLDARGRWVEKETQSIMLGIGTSLVVFAAVAFGLGHIDTPAVVRDMKLDEVQINDLHSIQWQIENYLTTSSTTPDSLDVAYADAAVAIPVAPEGREAYTYAVTAKGFELCATFSRDSSDSSDTLPAYNDPTARIKGMDDWRYQAGRYCFDRVVK